VRYRYISLSCNKTFLSSVFEKFYDVLKKLCFAGILPSEEIKLEAFDPIEKWRSVLETNDVLCL